MACRDEEKNMDVKREREKIGLGAQKRIRRYSQFMCTSRLSMTLAAHPSPCPWTREVINITASKCINGLRTATGQPSDYKGPDLVESSREHLPTVCVDLDGVLNTFDEWKGSEFFHPVRPGASEFLRRLYEAGYRVVILTVRWHEWVQKWLNENGMAQYVDMVADRKPPAHVYLDDRAICFTGDFDDAYGRIIKFKTFWEKL